MTIINHSHAEEQLRKRLTGGIEIGSALRELRASKSVDLLSLCHAVEIVCQLSSREAKKLVIKETSEGRHQS